MSGAEIVSIGADSDDGDSYPTVTFIRMPRIDHDVPTPERLLSSYLSPLIWARMDKANDGYEKPLWLMATIWSHHVNKGEPTSADRDLAERIRKRGIWQSTIVDKDECGHIVGNQVGGKMVSFNLFPQNKSLNKGWKSNYLLWKVLDYLIRKWVTLIPEKFNPNVEYQMRLYYGDSVHPDRPDSFKYSVGFFMSDDEEKDHETQKRITLTQTILNISLRAVQTVSVVNIAAVAKEIEEAIEEANMGGASEYQDWKRELLGFLRTRPTPTTPVSSEPSGSGSSGTLHVHRDRRVTMVDFIPVVGSVKGLVEGCEDLSDGNYVSGGVNLALGAGGLVLDCVTLGGAGLALNAGKGAAKAVGRTVVVQSVAKAAYVGSSLLKFFKQS